MDNICTEENKTYGIEFNARNIKSIAIYVFVYVFHSYSHTFSIVRVRWMYAVVSNAFFVCIANAKHININRVSN